MNLERNTRRLMIAAFVGALVVKTAIDIRQITLEEREKRRQFLVAVGTDVAAIHKAADILNAQIDRGEIRTLDKLRERMNDEIAFQKIALREEDN